MVHKSFASVILKVAVSAAVNPQFSIHFNESSILQLINGISNDLQKLLKYFNGTAIFTPFHVPSFPALPIRLAIYLNKGALLSLVTFVLLSSSSLLKSHKLPEVSE